MNEMDPREAEMDRLLRRSLAAPVPDLPADFDQRLLRKVRGGPGRLDRYDRWLLIGYSLVSVLACTVIMRGAGLDWGAIAGMTIAPLALVGAFTGIGGRRSPA